MFQYSRWITPKGVTSLRGPSPRHCTRATQLLSKKCRNGGEPLATLCWIWLAWNLILRPPAPETNALPLDQLAGSKNWIDDDDNYMNVVRNLKIFTIIFRLTEQTLMACAMAESLKVIINLLLVVVYTCWGLLMRVKSSKQQCPSVHDWL